MVGRLVPHKQVEHAIDTALALREDFPGLTLHVVGHRLVGGRACTSTPPTRDAGDTVVFEGHVDERRKHEIYERAWVLLLPSLKEGWGLVIPEAGIARDARPSPTARRAAPRSRSPTGCRACWSTTPPGWSRRPAGC